MGLECASNSRRFLGEFYLVLSNLGLNCPD